MMALTQQMQTYSVKQIKIRLKIKLLTHSKGASLDILIIRHNQLTNLELSWSTQNLASLNENGHCEALRVGLGPGTGKDNCQGQDLCIVLGTIHAVSLFFVPPVTAVTESQNSECYAECMTSKHTRTQFPPRQGEAFWENQAVLFCEGLRTPRSDS